MSEALIDRLLESLPEGRVETVLIGAHWTAVVVEVAGEKRCGLATSLHGEDDHHHGGGHAVPEAGRLHLRSGRELAELARSERPEEVSVGMAAVNGLLPPQAEAWVD